MVLLSRQCCRRLLIGVAFGTAILLSLGGSARSISGQSTLKPDITFEVTLRPVLDDSHSVVGMHVIEKLPANSIDLAVPVSFECADNYDLVSAIAERISGLTVTDAEGAVVIQRIDPGRTSETATNYAYWRTLRPLKPPVTIEFISGLQPERSHGGPPFGLRASGGGIAGAGVGFLLLPVNTLATSSHLQWDLAELPPGSIGILSSGEGSVTVPGPPSRLKEEWMMAGPVEVYRESGSDVFTGYVLGRPPFDAASDLKWAARIYFYIGARLRSLTPLPAYRAFIRTLGAPPYGGGTAMPRPGGGFLLSTSAVVDNNRPTSYLREMMAHEMTHQWVGHNAEDEAWFDEGLTVYASTILPYEGKLTSTAFFLEQINSEARLYYQNRARDWSEGRIQAAGMASEDVRTLPYHRGALYFAQLDHQIRARSRGRRTLFTVLRPLQLARQRGTPITHVVWEAMLLHELGPKSIVAFRSELVDVTKIILPPSDVFGPRFIRTQEVHHKAGSTITVYQWEPVAWRRELQRSRPNGPHRASYKSLADVKR